MQSKGAKTERGLSVTKAIFPMVGSILGSGILNLPCSVERSGYYISGPILLFISAVCAFTLYQLVHCSKNLQCSNPSYFKVTHNAFPLLGYVTEACIMAQGLGSGFVYLLILKKWIAGFIGIGDSLSLVKNFFFSLFILALPTFLAVQKDLKKLAFISILSTISVVFLSLVVLLSGVLSVILPPNGEVKDTLKTITSEPRDLFNSLSPYIFGLGCQQNMVKVFSLLEKPTKKNGAIVGTVAIAIASSAYFLVANGGYIAGGNNQDKSILDILEDKNKYFYKVVISNFGKPYGEMYFYLIKLAKVSMSVVLFGAFPLQMHPSRDSIITFLNFGMKDFISRNRRMMEIAIPLCVSTGLLFLSLLEIKYGYVMELIANTASCYIMFALPSISYILSSKTRPAFSGISWAILVGSLLFSITSLINMKHPFLSKK